MTENQISVISVAYGDAHWEKVRHIRHDVFIVEQAVDEAEEYDEFEVSSRHFLAVHHGIPVGTARWRQTKNGFKLERFAVLAEARKLGVGKALVKTVLEEVIPLAKAQNLSIYLHAQVQAIPFYAKLGFEAYGEEFIEAEIKHRSMRFQV